MTPTDLALEALAYIFASGAPAPSAVQATLANATAPQKRRMAADLTATMQEIYELAPALYRRRLGALLAAPVTADVTVTQGSQTVTTAQAFVEGSTVIIGGVQNQIRTENAVKTLLYPYAGPSGTVSAVFYGDCVPLGASVAAVIGAVALAGGIPLVKRVNREDFKTVIRGTQDYGRVVRVQLDALGVGVPSCYWVESFLLTGGANHASTLALRVNPLPKEAYTIGFDVRLAAPVFAVADLGTDGVASTRSFVVETGYVESTVRPIFLNKWAASPWFKDDKSAKRLAADDMAARARLVAYRPQQAVNRRIVAPM